MSQDLSLSSASMALQESDQVVPLQEPEPDPTFSQLTKQNSILSLTLDEFQYKSGKTFGSMNMDEFLASIWNSEDNQINPLPSNEEASSHSKIVATEPGISQKGAFSVPPPICKKTVDEVWSHIHKSQPQINEAMIPKEQHTLGEMTLEDFLIKAGVVQESPLQFKPSPQPRTTMPFQSQSGNMASNRLLLNASYGFRPAFEIGFSSNGLEAHRISSQNNSFMVKAMTVSHDLEKCQDLPESSSGGGSRKRIIDGPPEVVVKRRQRRMLKNRESAARSRARRQAYTVELEVELNLLKDENDKLKQILAEADGKRKQEILNRKHLTKPQRRTENLRAMGRPISGAW